jgi:hypothetical protein
MEHMGISISDRASAAGTRPLGRLILVKLLLWDAPPQRGRLLREKRLFFQGARDDVGRVLVATRVDLVHVLVDFLGARRLDDDAAVADADAPEDGREPEAQDDRDQDRPEVVLEHLGDDHGCWGSKRAALYTSELIFSTCWVSG